MKVYTQVKEKVRKRKSERIASRPKSNLTMQEQATRLLMKKCGIVDTNKNLEEGQQEKFRLQFVEPMKEMTVQGLRETFRLNGNEADPLDAIALEGDE